MALDATLTDLLKDDEFFQSRPAALDIVEKGTATIASDKPALYNLQCLLANMCAYGLANWTYAPGTPTNADMVLRKKITVTDCKSLAEIFLTIVQALEPNLADDYKFRDARVRKFEKVGYRIVTTAHLFAFNNHQGSADLEGRWCFGDHFVVECQGKCYDPTFKVTSFSFDAPPHLGWYAKETRTSPEALRTKIKTAWIDETGRNKTVFMKIPSGDYTFNAKDPMV
jgi:hypothetical protein